MLNRRHAGSRMNKEDDGVFLLCFFFFLLGKSNDAEEEEEGRGMSYRLASSLFLEFQRNDLPTSRAA